MKKKFGVRMELYKIKSKKENSDEDEGCGDFVIYIKDKKKYILYAQKEMWATHTCDFINAI